MLVGGEVVRVVAGVAGEGGQAVGQGRVLAAGLPVGEEVCSSASSTELLSSRLTPGMLITWIGVDSRMRLSKSAARSGWPGRGEVSGWSG